MANTRDIRRRIKSVKNTAQITKAMQMVAATKMRRSQTRALAGRPYAERLERVASHLSEQVIGVSHPLLTPRPVKKRAVLLLSTDRGLCGSLNTNLFREVIHHDKAENVYVTIGRKGRQLVPRLKHSGGQGKANLLADFEVKDNFAFAETKAVAQFLIDRYLAGEIDAVDVAYNHFVNALTQKPVIAPLLPIGRLPEAEPAPVSGEHAVYLCEPPAEDLLHGFLPFVVHFQVYQYLLDARASEHSARMVAMKNATENAKTLVKDLTLEYNKARQAAITTELLEITTAQLAIS
ncbi:MAG: ATP synthase F1 subunit gamma [Verrucomicrobium sp.]|nr:ATP synthase F1 subunit gamma [Verrucomicrobium sp.]